MRLQFPEPDALRSATGLLDTATADDERLELRVPSDGSVASLRRLLGLLDAAEIEVAQLSIHTPDLDDVFFAVTGEPVHEVTHVTALAYALTDSRTMLRRDLRRLLRYPSMTLMLVGMPIVFMVLFVFVFGGQLSHGLGPRLAGGHAGRSGYLNYLTPGILLMTVAAAVQGTAIVVAMDMTGGITDRFRTMAIARSVRARGPRPRGRHPDAREHRGRARGRARARLQTDRRPASTGSRRSGCWRCSRSR